MNPQSQGVGSRRGIHERLVSREMLYARTLELAQMAGRGGQQIKQIDYERAKLELTGESDFDRQQAMLELKA
ncbi:MAG: hypothetical protein V4819_16195 [Verrucomicrobiota bacterium]